VKKFTQNSRNATQEKGLHLCNPLIDWRAMADEYGHWTITVPLPTKAPARKNKRKKRKD